MNDKVILVLKKDKEFLSIYYNDGNHIFLKDKLYKYKVRLNKGHKNPLMIQGSFLHPTKSIKEKDCFFINLEYFEKDDTFYNCLLQKLGVYDKTIKMFKNWKKTV